MKAGIQKMAKRLEGAWLWTVCFAKSEANRFMTDNRGMNTIEMVALTVVIVGAVVVAGATLSDNMPGFINGLFTKVKELLGLS